MGATIHYFSVGLSGFLVTILKITKMFLIREIARVILTSKMFPEGLKKVFCQLLQLYMKDTSAVPPHYLRRLEKRHHQVQDLGFVPEPFCAWPGSIYNTGALEADISIL